MSDDWQFSVIEIIFLLSCLLGVILLGVIVIRG